MQQRENKFRATSHPKDDPIGIAQESRDRSDSALMIMIKNYADSDDCLGIRLDVPQADQSFLGDRGDEPALLGEDQTAIESAAA